MYNEKIEALIKAALADGELTEKEKQILFKRAESEGIDLDEFEMVLDARLFELKKAEQSAPQMSAPKSNKFGDIRKCPACGAIVTGGMASCQDCGYAFTNTNVNKTIEHLFEELTKIENEKKETSLVKELVFSAFTTGKASSTTQKKMNLIANFPIPNNREDLLETLSYIQNKADSTAPKTGVPTSPGDRMKAMNSGLMDENLGYAYWLLYCNCINKAKISFANDSSFRSYFDFYEQEKNKKSKKLFGWF